jgi:Protein of unknown function (DUF2964)
MIQKQWGQPLTATRRKLIRSKIHVLLAAIGTLAAVVGIAVTIDGGLEFNRPKVLIGACTIVVSTILYISMLFVAADD